MLCLFVIASGWQLAVAQEEPVAAPGTQPVQAPAGDGATDPVFKSWQKQAGVQECGKCHFAASAFSTPDAAFSKQNELQFWLANDKHAIARRRVEPLNDEDMVAEAVRLVEELELTSVPKDWFGASNQLSLRICEKMGYDVKTNEGYVLFRDNCLTCHGGYHGQGDQQEFVKVQDYKNDHYQPGISCNGCHQIDSNVAWIQQHGVQGADKQWRNLPPADKAAAGMRDLVNVSVQAANCYDCHIGNRSKDMFVTHVMYAAGHPPLPGVELQTFCTSMPQHWQGEAELYRNLQSFAGKDAYFTANFPNLFDGEKLAKLPPDKLHWDTRKMIVGALAARRQTVQLLIDSASPERWADYSLYDCAACHHELQEPSIRQLRGYVGAPGRPRQFEWPSALLTVALDVAGEDVRKNADASEAKLAAAFGQSPFGDPTVISQIGAELNQTLDVAIERAQSKPFSGVPARAILKRIASTPAHKLLVYDAARQVVWAIQSIAAELAAHGEPLPENLAAKITALGNPAVSGIEAALPAGRNVFIYSKNLDAELNRKAAFDVEKLAPLLAEISREIVVQPAAPDVAAR